MAGRGLASERLAVKPVWNVTTDTIPHSDFPMSVPSLSFCVTMQGRNGLKHYDMGIMRVAEVYHP